MLIIKPPNNVYVDEPYLSIRWDSAHNHVLSEWRAFANSAELRASLLRGIQAIRDNHAAAYISDARKVKVIVHDDQAWIKEKWMPMAEAAGLKRLAFVTAPTGLGKLTVEDVSSLVDHKELQSRTFDSLADARYWVAEVARADRVYLNRPGVALVTWNPDLKAVCLESQGWANSSEAQEALEAVIRALRANHGSRWLLDGRNMRVVKQADQDWITKTWLPRAAAAGLRLTALVMPKSGLAMTNIDDMARVSENGIDVRYFSTVAKAAEWLTSPPAAA
jgi:hypothetical protein